MPSMTVVKDDKFRNWLDEHKPATWFHIEKEGAGVSLWVLSYRVDNGQVFGRTYSQSWSYLRPFAERMVRKSLNWQQGGVGEMWAKA